MIKLPAREDGQWTVQYASDKMPDIVATKNLTFDKEGYLRLSKPVVKYYSEVEDADFGLPIGHHRITDGLWYILTDELQFFFDLGWQFDTGAITVTQDGNTNNPDNTDSDKPGYVWFYDDMVYVNPADRKCYKNSGGATINDWTISDTSAIIQETSTTYSACHFVSQSALAVGNGNKVDLINSSYAAVRELVLPDDFRVSSLAYNNGYLGITTHHSNNVDRSMFYVWDGNTTAANYVTEVPSPTGYGAVAYGGWFAFYDGNAILWQWTPTGITPITALPAYYTGAFLSIGQGNATLQNGAITDGELIFTNMKSSLRSPDETDAFYNQRQPGGVWTYDPAVGWYHRYAPSGAYMTSETIATTAVDTTDNEITVASAPETGTPCRYTSGSGTALAGLTNRGLYYVIKIDATTLKLATSYANALTATAIDLTGTGNNDQTLQYYPKNDFGQLYLSGVQGAVSVGTNRSIGDSMYYYDMLIGASCSHKTTTQYDTGCITLKDTENRGYFITSKLQSQQLQEDWQKIFIKHSTLNTALDKIVVKYRTDNQDPITKLANSNDGTITWTDSDTFTTTDTQWENVLAGDEVEVVQGAGSGYLLHVSSISESSGTYTVNLDEAVKNISASDTGRAFVSRWTKLTTLTSDTITNEDGYSDIAVGVKSKSIQFKIELRGEDVEIEEILVAHTLHKPVA